MSKFVPHASSQRRSHSVEAVLIIITVFKYTLQFNEIKILGEGRQAGLGLLISGLLVQVPHWA